MTKFNTGNPVGSSDPRDLFDNAAVADNLVTGPGAAYKDRLGKSRKSWQGMEDEFAAFIASSGYEFVGDYAAGIELTGYQQILRDTSGEFWRLSGSVTLPYTTTGSGLPEGGNFVAVGDATLRQELALPVSGGNGAALVNGATIYVGSVAELEAVNLSIGKSIVSLAPKGSTPMDAEFSALSAYAKDTGQTVYLGPGNYRITQPHSIEGFTLYLMEGAEIEVNGDDSSVFAGRGNGGITVLNNGHLKGFGVVYTSGTMGDTGSGDFAAPVQIEAGGTLSDKIKIYSQLATALRSLDGDVFGVELYGGYLRTFQHLVESDRQLDVTAEYYNAGIRYINKSPDPSVISSDHRAVFIQVGGGINADIESAITLNVKGNYSYKNGAWVQHLSNDYALKNVRVNGYILNAGFYLDAAGVRQNGQAAGSCISVQNCPDADVVAMTRYCRGYNVAVLNGSHRAKIHGGTHVGENGDPVIAVNQSDDVEIFGNALSAGTVIVAVGEEGAANNCQIFQNVIKTGANDPIRFAEGQRLSVDNNVIIGEPISASTVGNFSTTAAVRYAVGVRNNESRTAPPNDVSFTNNKLIGLFNFDVVDVGYEGRLRVTRNNNTYQAPITSSDTTYQKGPFSVLKESADFERLCSPTDTTGFNGVGETTIPSGNTAANITLASDWTDLSTLYNTADGEVLADVLDKYAVMVYVKYVSGMLGKTLRFGISDQSGSAGTQTGLAGNSFASSNIGTLYKPMNEGDYYPVVMTLGELLDSDADPNALVNFCFDKSGGTDFDFTITNPVIVYVGQGRRS